MVKIRLSIDRFEGDKHAVAVLIGDDGTQTNVPRRWLPKDARAGDVLSVTIERDAGATSALAEKTKKVQDQLKAEDHGGDIAL